MAQSEIFRMSKQEKRGLFLWIFLFMVITTFTIWYRSNEYLPIPEARIENVPFISEDSTPPTFTPISAAIFPAKKERKKSPNLEILNLNTADSISLEKLPWIGPVMAGRIIEYRKRLGGYLNIGQLKEIYGMREELFEKMIPRLTTDGVVNPIFLNTDTKEKMGKHPYIGWHRARLIINYRQQHERFNSWQDVWKTMTFDSSSWLKARPYLNLGPP